jgi:hypothetical protein
MNALEKEELLVRQLLKERSEHRRMIFAIGAWAAVTTGLFLYMTAKYIAATHHLPDPHWFW